MSPASQSDPRLRDDHRTDGRGSALAAGGRARGIVVGSLIALGWAVYGASIFGPGGRALAVAVAVVLTAALVLAAILILRRVRAMPPPTPAQIGAGKRAWRWFWANLVGEIVLLNVVVALLGAPELQIYWIAAISGVVGLHFLPMAVFFRTRSYWFVGGAMIAGAIVAALLIARFPASAADIAYCEGLANAVILWCALAAGAAGVRPITSHAVSPS